MQSYEYYDGYGFERNPNKLQYIVLGELDNHKIICYIHGYNFICKISNKTHQKAWNYISIDILKCIKCIKSGLIYLKTLLSRDENKLITYNFANEFLYNLIETYSIIQLKHKSIIKIQKQFRKYMLYKRRLIIS